MARELPDPRGKSEMENILLDSNFIKPQAQELEKYIIFFNDNREPLIITAKMGIWKPTENQLRFYADTNEQEPVAVFRLDSILGFSLTYENVESSRPLGLELNPPRLALPAPQN